MLVDKVILFDELNHEVPKILQKKLKVFLEVPKINSSKNKLWVKEELTPRDLSLSNVSNIFFVSTSSTFLNDLSPSTCDAPGLKQCTHLSLHL